jgi:hypothetical protein
MAGDTVITATPEQVTFEAIANNLPVDFSDARAHEYAVLWGHIVTKALRAAGMLAEDTEPVGYILAGPMPWADEEDNAVPFDLDSDGIVFPDLESARDAACAGDQLYGLTELALAAGDQRGSDLEADPDD